MELGSGMHSRQTSSKVATLLDHLLKNPEDFGVLQVVTLIKRSGSHPHQQKEDSLLIKVDVSRPPVELAAGRQLIFCHDKGGRRVDIILSSSATRALEPGLVLIAKD